MSRLTDFARAELTALADPERAPVMAAYLKTQMPFYGVQRPGLRVIARAIKKQFPPADRDEYEVNTRDLWGQPHREEKYLAISYARAFTRHQTLASLALYEDLIRQGAWWDLVDEVASNLLGAVWKTERESVGPIMDRWIADDDIWIRRSAVIGQLKHKSDTDTDRLLRYCRVGAPDPSFWMRKAIGWALRQHSKTDAELVRAFLAEMGDDLSGLSRREASKYL